MKRSWQFLKIAAALAVVVALGILVGWLGTHGSQSPQSPSTPSLRGTTSSSSESAAGKATTEHPPKPPHPTQVATPPDNRSPSITVAAVPANVISNWEDRLNDILPRANEDASAKAKELLEMFPQLPEDGKIEVAHHLANLTDDKEFTALGAYLTAPGTPEPVIDVLMADLLNRPNSVKLPLLLDVAKSCPDAKTADEAKDILSLFLDEDHGNDWMAWQARLQQWLAENPD